MRTLVLCATILPVYASAQTVLNGPYSGLTGTQGVAGSNGANGADGAKGTRFTGGKNGGGGGNGLAGGIAYTATGPTLVTGGDFTGGNGGDGGNGGTGGIGGKGGDGGNFNGWGGDGGDGGNGGTGGNGGKGGFGLVVPTSVDVVVRGGAFFGGGGGGFGAGGNGGYGGNGGKPSKGAFDSGGGPGTSGTAGAHGSHGAVGLGMLVQGTVTLYGLTGSSIPLSGNDFRAMGTYADGSSYDFTYRLDGGSFAIQGVPEPSTLLALPLGLLALRRRRKA